MQTPIPSSGTPVQLTLLSWPDRTPGGRGRGGGGTERKGGRRGRRGGIYKITQTKRKINEMSIRERIKKRKKGKRGRGKENQWTKKSEQRMNDRSMKKGKGRRRGGKGRKQQMSTRYPCLDLLLLLLRAAEGRVLVVYSPTFSPFRESQT